MEKENDLLTASPRSIQEPKRGNACEGSNAPSIEVPRRRLHHCRRNGLPRSSQRSPAGNKTTARGGSPGFRVAACVLLPKAARLSGSMYARSPATVAGAAAELHRVPIQCSAHLARARIIPDIRGARARRRRSSNRFAPCLSGRSDAPSRPPRASDAGRRRVRILSREPRPAGYLPAYASSAAGIRDRTGIPSPFRRSRRVRPARDFVWRAARIFRGRGAAFPAVKKPPFFFSLFLLDCHRRKRGGREQKGFCVSGGDEPLPWLARASATRIPPAWVTATTSPPSLPRT